MPWNIESLLERIGLIKDDSIGIAFSGGGARGFAHLGVIRALEAFDVRPTVMSGVSAGSIASVLYAAGLTPEQIADCFAEADGLNYFMEWSLPKEGFLRLSRFARHLESWLPVKNLEDLKIPTVVCATDLDHGKSVGWSRGEIVPRVVASCSIPIVFHPQKINGIHYVDGGVLRNLPAWAIRKHCRILFGSNCSPLNHNYSYSSSIISLAMRSYALMSKANTAQDLRLCNHVIQTRAMHNVGTFQLSMMKQAIDYGYEAGCRVLEKALK